MRKPVSKFILLQCMIFCFSCQPKKTMHKPPSALIGAWEMKEIRWSSSDTTVAIREVQPGMLLITPSKYSIMWTPTKGPRIPFKNLSAPDMKEIKSGFASIIFNAGEYKLTDSTFFTTAQISKVPGFEGGKQFYRYRLEKDLLRLTMYDETYPDKSKPDWSGTWETHFLLERTVKKESIP